MAETARDRIERAARLTGMLDVPYPLRPDFVATVSIPRDMTGEEAARLAAFVQTLPIPDALRSAAEEGP